MRVHGGGRPSTGGDAHVAVLAFANAGWRPLLLCGVAMGCSRLRPTLRLCCRGVVAFRAAVLTHALHAHRLHCARVHIVICANWLVVGCICWIPGRRHICMPHALLQLRHMLIDLSPKLSHRQGRMLPFLYPHFMRCAALACTGHVAVHRHEQRPLGRTESTASGIDVGMLMEKSSRPVEARAASTVRPLSNGTWI